MRKLAISATASHSKIRVSSLSRIAMQTESKDVITTRLSPLTPIQAPDLLICQEMNPKKMKLDLKRIKRGVKMGEISK